MRDAVSAAWSLLGNRLGAQAGVADPNQSTWPASTGGWLTGPVPGPTTHGPRGYRRADRFLAARVI